MQTRILRFCGWGSKKLTIMFFFSKACVGKTLSSREWLYHSSEGVIAQYQSCQ